MGIFLKVLVIILAVLAVAALGIYFAVLRYPKLKENPKVGKWYRVSDKKMKDSEGHGYHHCHARCLDSL
ncbi:MAG: hypothetical protein IKZ82_11030 [Clostridia bacterium]|nr:hypothetical protein [Clostridia bacterium]